MNRSVRLSGRRNDSPQNGGFTLIEMMIVLAVMAAMAALTLPAMRAPLDKSRLRAAGRQLQAALARTRATAIRQAVVMEFVHEIGGGEWKIQRAGLSPLISGPTADFGPGDDLETNQPDSPVVRKGKLPNGVRFLSNAELALQDAAATSVMDEADNEERLDPAARSWSAPIPFRPNGRSEDASFTVIGSRDFAVTISIRGLTSAVSYSTPFRLPPSVMAATVDDGSTVLARSP